MSARRYLHVGMPKSLSTALQRDVFAAHPALRHLGVGCGSNVDYLDPDVELAVEGHLMFCKDLRYREKEVGVHRTFARHFAAADADPRVLAVGISNESLSFATTPGHLDTTVKAQRLQAIFGRGAEVILILRNQPALLRSLYGESIRNGYAGSYRDFLTWLYLYQDRSFLYDILYDRTFDLYAELFGPEHVHVVPLEEHRSGNELTLGPDGIATIVTRLCAILGVPAAPLAIARHNDALPPAVQAVKERLNRAHPHDAGHSLLRGVANAHRLRQYFARDLQWDATDWLYDDVKRKRALIAQATSEAAVATETVVDDQCPAEMWDRLRTLFADANRALEQRLGHPLLVVPRPEPALTRHTPGAQSSVTSQAVGRASLCRTSGEMALSSSLIRGRSVVRFASDA